MGFDLHISRNKNRPAGNANPGAANAAAGAATGALAGPNAGRASAANQGPIAGNPTNTTGYHPNTGYTAPGAAPAQSQQRQHGLKNVLEGAAVGGLAGHEFNKHHGNGPTV